MDEASLSIYSFGVRVGYQLLIWPIITFGTIGNLLVFWRISFGIGIKSPLKPMYRGALLSLATSDLLLLATSGTNILTTLIRPNVIWILPDWACSILPFLQTTAALTSSLTLAAVATDRYRAIKPTYPPPTGPRWPMVVILLVVIWCISFGASYPVLNLYSTQSLIVVTNVTYYRASMCVTTDRSQAANVYLALYIAIFLPLAIVFFGIHLLLALKIWRSRRHGEIGNLGSSSDSQFTETSAATTSTARASPITLRRPMSSPPFVQRKKRTVKIILTLILVFTMCRLPMWTFAVVKLYVALSSSIWWHVQAFVTTLSLLNTAVNPILYTFVNEALSIFTWIRSWCTKTDEANLTPGTPEKLKSNVASIKVPRGPYSP